MTSGGGTDDPAGAARINDSDTLTTFRQEKIIWERLNIAFILKESIMVWQLRPPPSRWKLTRLPKHVGQHALWLLGDQGAPGKQQKVPSRPPAGPGFKSADGAPTWWW